MWQTVEMIVLLLKKISYTILEFTCAFVPRLFLSSRTTVFSPSQCPHQEV